MSNLEKRLSALPIKSRISINSVCYWLTIISVQYGIPIIFTGVKKNVKQLIIDNLFVHIVNNL